MIASHARGTGPDIVWAHGLAVNRHMWQPQLDALDEQFRCITFDARGHGGSPAGDATIGIPQAVEDLLAAADAHGAERFALVGASMGARTVIETAIARPERVTALVISDITDQSGTQAQQRLLGAADALAAADDGGRAILSAGPGADTFAAHEVAHGREPLAGLDPAAIAATLRNLSAGRPALADLAADLAALRCPVLIVHGSADAPSRAASQAVAGFVPGARVVEIAGAGHLASLAAPAAWTAAVDTFLRAAVTARSPRPALPAR